MTITPNIEYFLMRRSVKAKALAAPAPNHEELEQILTAAMRVPDHGKLAPWRLIVCDEAGQKALGERIAARFAALNPTANDKQIAFEAARPQRAPLLVIVMSVPKVGKIPVWEQELSAGALCMNMLHAAHALAYAGQWLTEWPAFDAHITQSLCAEQGAKVAGFMYIGTAQEQPDERARPNISDVVSYYT